MRGGVYELLSVEVQVVWWRAGIDRGDKLEVYDGNAC